MRLSQGQRETFLEVLGETENRRPAAEAIGVEPADGQRRTLDRLLDRQWREALPVLLPWSSAAPQAGAP